MDEDRIDETPYAEFSVPDLFSQISNNNGCRQYQTKLGSSFTQEDLRIDSHHPGLDQKQQISSASQGCHHQSQATISGSGQSISRIRFLVMLISSSVQEPPGFPGKIIIVIDMNV